MNFIKTNEPNGNISPVKPFPKWLDAFYMAVILLVCIKLTYDVLHIVDFMFADESFYLQMGANFRFSYLFKDGGLYYLWLKLIIAFSPGMILAYCWNYALLVGINSFLFYILFRKIGRTPFASALFSIFFLITILNVVTWPFITRFALAVFLVTLITVLSVKKPMTKYLAALGGLLLLAYTRPEFVMALMLFSAASVLYFAYKIFKDRTHLRTYGILILCPLIVAAFVLLVKNPVSGGRSVFAFGQHYGVNLEKGDKLKDVDSWLNWREVMKDRFHTDKSLLEAFKNNPGEVAKHMMTNVKQFPLSFFYQLFPFHTQNAKPVIKQVVKYLIILVFLASLVFFIKRMIDRFKAYKTNKEKGLTATLFPGNEAYIYGVSFLLILPVSFSLFVIFPRTHYMLSLFGILYPLIVINFPGIPTFLNRYVGSALKTIVCIVLVLWIPWKASGSNAVFPPAVKKSCSYISKVMAIKQIPVKSDVRLLGMILREDFGDDFFGMYLQDQSKVKYNIYRLEKQGTVEELIGNKQINMIYINSSLLETKPVKRMLREAQAKGIVQDIETSSGIEKVFAAVTGRQWVRFDIPGCRAGDEYVLVNAELLN